MLRALDDLVEQRIREAQQRGEFDALPGAGRPLAIEDDSLVPEELRVALRVLKNAGMVPPQVHALRDLDALLAEMVAAEAGDGEACDRNEGDREAGDGEDRARRRSGARRLLAITMALEAQGLGTVASALPEYRQRLMERLASGRES
jgi:hypothetical protein